LTSIELLICSPPSADRHSIYNHKGQHHMARTPAAAPRAPARAAAPPPPAPVEEDATSVYEELWNCAVAGDAAFQPPGDGESDQDFFVALVNAAAQAPEEVWDAMSDEAKEWYNFAAEAKGAEIPVPDGYIEEGGEAEEEAVEEPAAAPVAAAPAKGQQPAGLAKWRQDKAAEKAAAAAAAPAPVAPPAPAARRGTRAAAPAPAAAPAAPARGGRRAAPAPAPAPTPAPVRRAAPQAAPAAAPAARTVARQNNASGVSMMEVLRQYIIYNMMQNPPVEVTIEDVMQYATSQGFTPQRSTVSGVVTTTKGTMQTAIAYGWTPPAK
jgi:hypothetical protein